MSSSWLAVIREMYDGKRMSGSDQRRALWWRAMETKNTDVRNENTGRNIVLAI